MRSATTTGANMRSGWNEQFRRNEQRRNEQPLQPGGTGTNRGGDKHRRREPRRETTSGAHQCDFSLAARDHGIHLLRLSNPKE